MSASISNRALPRGVQAGTVVQELVFFIGPSPSNLLSSSADFERRIAETEQLLAGEPLHAELKGLFELAYSVKIKRLEVTVRSGGKRGVMCPNLCVDLVKSVTDDGIILYRLSNPSTDTQICQGLIYLLDADWIDFWWMGSLGAAQINCERGEIQ